MQPRMGPDRFAFGEGRPPCRPAVLSPLLGLLLLSSAPAAAPRTLTLQLDGGAGGGGTVEMDLGLRDGQLDGTAWGAAYGYNLNQHPGTVVVSNAAADRLRARVTLGVLSDPVAPGGLATFDLDLRRAGETYDGRYTGTFLDFAVTGAVSGAAAPSVIRETPGFAPPAAGEHPRLIFRKRDLPELRRRMETPEGKAIVAMLTERAPLREAAQVSDRHTSWMAANWGALYQLTGDTNAPAQARRVLAEHVFARPLPADRKDMHHGSRLLGVALAYDLCHDAWDEAYRRLVAEYLRVSASELADGRYEGFEMDAATWDPAPWGHRNAIRMACAGVAAMAILGDPGTDGTPLPDADRVIRFAERHVLQYLRLGLTQAGLSLEGPVPRNLALANGVLHFLHASRVARGRDGSDAAPLLLAGNVLTAQPAAARAGDFGLSSISAQGSGLWPIGLGSAPAAMLPTLKGCFDRDAGLAGKGHFGCAYPYQAAYALMNYPFGVEPKPEGEGLPSTVADPAGGHFVLRSGWRDDGDAIADLYLNGRGLPPPRGGQERLAAGVLNVSGLGTNWVSGFWGASRMNDVAAGELLYAEPGAGSLVVGADLSGLYLPSAGPSFATARKSREFRRIQKVQWQRDEIQTFLKTVPPSASAAARPAVAPGGGPRVRRHVALDVSGACGAPLLLAVVETASGEVPNKWRVPVVGAVKSAAGGFVVGDGAGPNLAARIVTPAGATLSGGHVAGKGEYFVVMTLQRGSAPAVRVEGTGLAAKVTVGGRTVAFDGARLVLK